MLDTLSCPPLKQCIESNIEDIFMYQIQKVSIIECAVEEKLMRQYNIN